VKRRKRMRQYRNANCQQPVKQQQPAKEQQQTSESLPLRQLQRSLHMLQRQQQQQQQ
jgi:hypothetical protein